MKPTRWPLLVLAAVVAGAVAYFVTRSSYDELPTPRVYALLGVALLAVAEAYLAATTRARLRGSPGTRPVDPLVVARFAALAKASSVVGSLAAGGYAGFLIWVAKLDTTAANRDTKTASFGVGCALLLVAAALFLEHVCRVPKVDDDDEPPPSH